MYNHVILCIFSPNLAVEINIITIILSLNIISTWNLCHPSLIGEYGCLLQGVQISIGIQTGSGSTMTSTPWSPKLTHNSYCTQWNGQFGKPKLISLLERCRDALKYQEYSPKNHERTHGAEVGNIDYNLKLQILLPRREAIMKKKSNEWDLLVPLHWRHNDHDGVSNHQPHGCLLNRFGRRSKKTSKVRVTGPCAGNSAGPVNSPHKGPVTRKMFPFDDVTMLFYSHGWEEQTTVESQSCCFHCWHDEADITIQCGVVITRSVFSKSSQRTPHSSPVRARYGMSVVTLKSNSVSATVIAVPCVIQWWIGPRYNGSWLYCSSL